MNTDKPLKIWGEHGIDVNAIRQMHDAMQIPCAVKGALMPDAHLGYGLPIGGVIALENAVAPFLVGVDIACRMKLTVTDLNVERLTKDEDKLIDAIERETAFGKGCSFSRRRQHGVMDKDWKVCDITKKMKCQVFTKTSMRSWLSRLIW
jgi:tRNA-splicing ligase RtcB